MNNPPRVAYLIILASLVLSACGSSPPVNYYALTPSAIENRTDADDAVILGLGPLAMPDYLNRSQMVTRGPGAAIAVDEFNRWAEPLGPAMHRALAADVDNMLDNVVVVSFPYDSAIRKKVDYRILGVVTRFDADTGGTVVLEVQWALSELDSDAAVKPQRSRYSTQAASAGNAAAVAEAMTATLRQFSRDIADQLSAVL